MKKISSLFYIQVSSILILFGIGISYSYHNLNSIEDEWNNYVNITEKKLIHLARLKRHTGYGGGIHHFKNYILRRNPSHLAEAEEHFKKAEEQVLAIEQYQTSEQEGRALEKIRQTIHSYLEKIQWMKSDPNHKKLSAEQIDKKVRIDDSLALESQFYLSEYYERGNDTIRANIIERFQNEEIFYAITLTLFFMFFVGFFFLTRWKLRRIDTALNSVSHLVDESINEIYVLDLETLKYKYTNNGAQQNLGYSFDELRNTSPWDHCQSINKESFIANVTPVIQQTQKSLCINCKFQRKDGSQYHAQVNVQKSMYLKKPVLLFVVLDVSAQVEEREEHQKTLSDRLVEQFTINRLLEIPTSPSVSLEAKLSTVVQEILAVPWISIEKKAALFLKDESEKMNLILSENLNLPEGTTFVLDGNESKGRPVEFQDKLELKVSPKDGHLILPEGHYNVPIIAEDETLGVLLLYLADNHEKKLSEMRFLESCAEVIARIIVDHQMQLTFAQIKEKEAVRALVTTYNHEINNPLAIAHGSLTLLKKAYGFNENTEKLKVALERIEEIVVKISKLSNQSKIDFESYANKARKINFKKSS